MSTEKFWLWLAWVLPKDLVTQCFARVAAHATCGKWGNQVVPELLAMDALKRWIEPA